MTKYSKCLLYMRWAIMDRITLSIPVFFLHTIGLRRTEERVFWEILLIFINRTNSRSFAKVSTISMLVSLNSLDTICGDAWIDGEVSALTSHRINVDAIDGISRSSARTKSLVFLVCLTWTDVEHRVLRSWSTDERLYQTIVSVFRLSSE